MEDTTIKNFLSSFWTTHIPEELQKDFTCDLNSSGHVVSPPPLALVVLARKEFRDPLPWLIEFRWLKHTWNVPISQREQMPKIDKVFWFGNVHQNIFFGI